MRLEEGILWIANFVYLIIWAIVGQIPVVQKSVFVRKILIQIFGIVSLALFSCFHFVLGLSLKTLFILLIVFIIPMLFSVILKNNWKEVMESKFDQAIFISSWFSHCFVFIAVGMFLNSSIWFIGAIIILITGISNIYFELIVKKAIKHLNPKIKKTYRLSGFVLDDEIWIIVPTVATSFLYFPLFYYKPFLIALIQNIISSEALIFTFLGAMFAALIEFVSVAWTEGNKELRAILARVFIGFLSICTILLLLIAFGSALNSMGNLNLQKAFTFNISVFQKRPSLDFWLTVNQIWFTAMVALLINIVFYGSVIIHLVMGGRISSIKD